MDNLFFKRPILNSPYEYPSRHWELDKDGQPTQKIIERRRFVELITPIPKPKKRRQNAHEQQQFVFDEGKGISTQAQRYDPTPIINELRTQVDRWRELPNPNDWRVTPETARLLQHWRHHRFGNIRPFFCQVEAAETVIWLTEVAPQIGKAGKGFLEHLVNANNDANPELMRLALKMATGAGKTTVMAMLIAWQTINAVRRSASKRFTRGFLVVTPGLTIRDRLRVLMPNDPDSYYQSRELIPSDMLAEHFTNSQQPFDYAVVDEAQDISVAQLRFLASFSAGKPDCLMFTGDLGQRIFQQPFSWRALGIDIRGRSRTLRINYRTSHQIRMQADRLLAPELSDVDGNTEDRRGTISVFNGPSPAVKVLETADEESEVVGSWLTQLTSDGLSPHEIAIFVRSDDQLDRACKAADNAKLPYKIIDHNMTISSGHIVIGTMHLAKGLEFRAVAVMACDDEVIPSQQRIERVTDDSDLEVVYNTERHLLYVACTRARDHLLITSADPASEFLDDLRM